jgi:DNA (cytosine-5)-methyltransferase 1
MTKPRLLDLFCGAGGCAKGYQRAGFYVVGVDIRNQPRYCGDEFYQGDALEYLAAHGREFAAIHASPPCQGYTGMNRRWAKTRDAHPRLIEATRKALQQTGRLYVIENVQGAPLLNPVCLCGSSFGLGTYRHRLFEADIPLLGVPCRHRSSRTNLPIYGKLDGRRLWSRTDGSELRAPRELEQASKAMEIDWMTWEELREAIPPAYCEFIGRQLMQYLKGSASVA